MAPSSVARASSSRRGNFGTPGRPAPRAIRAKNCSATSRAPVASAIRWAAASGRSCRAAPPNRSTAPLPLRRNRSAICSTAVGSGAAGRAGGSGSAGMPPESQHVSDGRIRVAMWPFPPRDACTASAASAPSLAAEETVRTQAETARAHPSVSAASGGSSGRWKLAWSPTQLTMATPARRALCRLASPFASPGPQWSNVAAGFWAIRP